MRLIGTLEQYLTNFERETQETYDVLCRKLFCVFAQMPHNFITKPLKSQP